MYCSFCGSLLILKEDGQDGLVPYCNTCMKFAYPKFNVAISAIVICDERILLIKQYKKNDYILVAGYVTKGESAEEALIREIKEETNLKVSHYEINKTEYYEKSNTLMINFTAFVTDNHYVLNDEVDSANWFLMEESLLTIKKDSLAKKFLEYYLSKQN